MMPRAESEEGFSLVEVLVALLIASLVLVALGSILAFVATVQNRSAESELMLADLLNLQALSAELEKYGTTATVISSLGVTWMGRDEAARRIEITLNDAKQLSVIVEGKLLNLIDFAAFDSVSLDGFWKNEAEFSWRSLSDKLDKQPLLIRVVLIKGRKTWWTVIWGRNGLIGQNTLVGEHAYD